LPREEWDAIGHTLIFHGRRICTARKPACAACAVNDVCPSAFKAELVGRKARGDRAPEPAVHAGKKKRPKAAAPPNKSRRAKVVSRALAKGRPRAGEEAP
jgi:endonuclease-3